MSSPNTFKVDDHERPTSADASQTPGLGDRDRPRSIDSASSYSPQVTAATSYKQRDLATEILGPNYPLVFGASSTPSPQISQVDSQYLVRMSGISALSLSPSSGPLVLPARSPTTFATKQLPSPTAPPIAHAPSLSTTLESSIEKNISSPVAVSDSLGFAFKAPEAPERARPMKAVKEGRRSMFIEDLEEQKSGHGVERPAISGEGSTNSAKFVDWPLTTPSASPALGSRFRDSSTAVDDSEASDARANSPQQMATPFVTVISPEAKKSPRINFLTKFLRGKSPDGPSIRPAIEGKLPAEEVVSPKSFFDDESSDGGEDSQIESAQQARTGTPVMVKSGPRTRVGLKQMLGSTPPGRDLGLGSPKRKMVKLSESGPDESGVKESSMKSLQKRKDEAVVSKSGSQGAGLWKETVPFSPRTPKSQESPSQFSPITTPSPRSKGPRKVSFPGPPPLDIKPEHRSLRQSIVSTPYPSGENDEQPYKRVMPASGTVRKGQKQDDIESVLTLVTYGNGDLPPKVKKIMIPFRQEMSPFDSSAEKTPPAKTTIAGDFDDERLFRLIRREYVSMRGPFRHLTSARFVRGIKLLSYQSRSQLVARHAKPMHLDVKEEDGDFAEARILKLYRAPKKGRRRHEWTQWIRSQPENIVETPSELDHLALELVEGWSPRKLYLAVATVLACSLLTTLLWIFLGASGGNLALQDTFGASTQLNGQAAGYRGAGGRVGSGAVLGLLVLLFGWSVVGAWVLLSWLIC